MDSIKYFSGKLYKFGEESFDGKAVFEKAKGISASVVNTSKPYISAISHVNYAEHASKVTKIPAVLKCIPTDYVFASVKGKNVLRILDRSNGKWLLRVDKGHATGATYPHINVNSKFTKVPDPHLAISNSTLSTASALSTTVKVLNDVCFYVFCGSVVLDGYRIYTTAKSADEAAKMAATTATEMGCSVLGGYAGGKAGAVVGGTLGSAAGPVGTAVGGVSGCILGAMAGAISGLYGSSVLENAVKDMNSDVSK